ncbi:MAG: hypothetical protein GX069_06205 [Tissierellia bacterium]|nr:hypothetical protein [Tissierellia bacterium]
MKKMIIIILIILIVLSLFPRLSSHIRSYRNKTKIIRIVKENLYYLNNSIENASYKDGQRQI